MVPLCLRATEYSDFVLAARVVDSLETAITYINTYGSGHTDAVITKDAAVAEAFMARVDAAGVFHNCSTSGQNGKAFTHRDLTTPTDSVR